PWWRARRPQHRPVAPRLAAHRLRPLHPRLREAHLPCACQGHADRSRRTLRPRHHGAGLAHAEDSGPGRRELGRLLQRPERHRLPRPGVHRGRGPRLRGLARRPQALAAAEQALPGAICRIVTIPFTVPSYAGTIISTAAPAEARRAFLPEGLSMRQTLGCLLVALLALP